MILHFIRPVAAVGDIIVDLGIKISAIFLVIGFVDLVYQRIKFKMIQ